MASEPYLIRLGNRLLNGLAKLDPDRRDRHRTFVLSQQMPDGGFRGREGDSDLYYTSFAVRCLTILGGMTPQECEQLGEYVKSQNQSRLSIIDLFSWLYTGLAVQLSGGEDPFVDAASDWTETMAETLESVRTKDGGYAKTTEGASGSTYHTFLVALVYELIGKQIPDPNALIRFLYDRQRDDGGFVEIAPMKRSGTNPTAATVALLTMFDAMDDELRQEIREFLEEVKSGNEGFCANTRIPFTDGLSTFTGLLTAQDLGFSDILKPSRVEQFFTSSLEFPTGGFRGAEWDDRADVEYTFYGLGTLGLLWSADNSDEW